MKEKRRHFRIVERLPISVAVEHEVEVPGVPQRFEARSDDVSAGGMRFSTKYQLPRGIDLRLTFKLAGIGIVTAMARVCWLLGSESPGRGGPWEVGVQFHADRHLEEKLARYVLDVQRKKLRHLRR